MDRLVQGSPYIFLTGKISKLFKTNDTFEVPTRLTFLIANILKKIEAFLLSQKVMTYTN